MEDLTTSLGTAFTSVSTNVLSILKIALPAGIGIVAIIMAIKLGVKFFKQVSNNG